MIVTDDTLALLLVLVMVATLGLLPFVQWIFQGCL